MNWYNLAKISSLEPLWWDRFYYHLSQNAEFLLNENGIKLITCSSVGKRFYSGIDGRKVFFSFCASYKNKTYNCGINFEFDFDSGLPASALVWEKSNLVQIKTKENNINMIKGSWHSIGYLGKEYNVTGRGFFLPQNANPTALINLIKTSILEDGNDDNDGDDEVVEPTPPPVNKRKVPFHTMPKSTVRV